MNDSENTDQARREALKKLASLTAYSTPAIVTLLTPSLSYAQLSETLNNPKNKSKKNVERCQEGLVSNLPGNLGHNSGGVDTASDCPEYNN